MEWIHLAQGFCKHGNKFSAFIKCGEFLGLKEDRSGVGIG
jgi:hypothetical protein